MPVTDNITYCYGGMELGYESSSSRYELRISNNRYQDIALYVLSESDGMQLAASSCFYRMYFKSLQHSKIVGCCLLCGSDRANSTLISTSGLFSI